MKWEVINAHISKKFCHSIPPSWSSDLRGHDYIRGAWKQSHGDPLNSSPFTRNWYETCRFHITLCLVTSQTKMTLESQDYEGFVIRWFLKAIEQHNWVARRPKTGQNEVIWRLFCGGRNCFPMQTFRKVVFCSLCKYLPSPRLTFWHMCVCVCVCVSDRLFTDLKPRVA